MSGANVINFYGLFLVHKYISVEYAVIHTFVILLTRRLSAIIYVKTSVVDNIGPWLPLGIGTLYDHFNSGLL
jgi:hypothetical protein